MARPKRSIYSPEERAQRKEVKKRKKAIAEEFNTKRPKKSFDKLEERKSNEGRRKRKREESEKKGGYQVLDHGEKAAECKKYVASDCERTARLARSEGKDPHRGGARRAAYKSGRVKECRTTIAPKGGYVACQKKITGDGYRLINKTRIGEDKVKLSRKSKKSKVTKKLVGPKKKKRIVMSMRRMSETKKSTGPKGRKPIVMFRDRFQKAEESKYG